MQTWTLFAGRLLLAHIFLLAGINKIPNYAGTAGYMDAMGVPSWLLPLVIILEIGGALALIVGVRIRDAAFALAAFTLLAGLIFHNNFADQTQMIMFMKNLSITGGLLILAVTADLQGLRFGAKKESR